MSVSLLQTLQERFKEHTEFVYFFVHENAFSPDARTQMKALIEKIIVKLKTNSVKTVDDLNLQDVLTSMNARTVPPGTVQPPPESATVPVDSRTVPVDSRTVPVDSRTVPVESATVSPTPLEPKLNKAQAAFKQQWEPFAKLMRAGVPAATIKESMSLNGLNPENFDIAYQILQGTKDPYAPQNKSMTQPQPERARAAEKLEAPREKPLLEPIPSMWKEYCQAVREDTDLPGLTIIFREVIKLQNFQKENQAEQEARERGKERGLSEEEIGRVAAAAKENASQVIEQETQNKAKAYTKNAASMEIEAAGEKAVKQAMNDANLALESARKKALESGATQDVALAAGRQARDEVLQNARDRAQAEMIETLKDKYVDKALGMDMYYNLCGWHEYCDARRAGKKFSELEAIAKKRNLNRAEFEKYNRFCVSEETKLAAAAAKSKQSSTSRGSLLSSISTSGASTKLRQVTEQEKARPKFEEVTESPQETETQAFSSVLSKDPASYEALLEPLRKKLAEIESTKNILDPNTQFITTALSQAFKQNALTREKYNDFLRAVQTNYYKLVPQIQTQYPTYVENLKETLNNNEMARALELLDALYNDLVNQKYHVPADVVTYKNNRLKQLELQKSEIVQKMRPLLAEQSRLGLFQSVGKPASKEGSKTESGVPGEAAPAESGVPDGAAAASESESSGWSDSD